MAATIFIKFCGFIAHSKLNDMALSAFPGKILVTRIIFFLLCELPVILWASWLKRQGAWIRAGLPGFDHGCRRGGDFSSVHVQTGPGVLSTSYKMSTGEFSRSKGGRAYD